MAAASVVGPSRLIPDLPDDITIACIVRIPRTFHPELSLVARSWRSLLRSPLLFVVRSDLGFSESFLCVNIQTPTDPSRWYLLDFGHPCRQDRLFPLPPIPVATIRSACAAAGPLYVLGGYGKSSSTVQVFDTRINRWAPAPRMSVARPLAAAAANLNGRIYPLGGLLPASEFWAEALDPSVSAWVPVPSPPHLRVKWMYGSAVLSGRLIAVADRGGVVYDPAAPEEERWGIVPPELDVRWKGRVAVVGVVLFAICDLVGNIRGYHLGAGEWKEVEGLEGKLPRFLCMATLANLGGMLCLVWEGEMAAVRRRRWRLILQELR